MDNSTFNLNVFTHITKQICMCTFISILLIILFIISPLSNLIKTSIFMKLIILVLIIYTIYLNILQTSTLKNVNVKDNSPIIKSQLNINIICSYIFTLFLGLLGIFVIKSFM
jgi:hypothetical protein